MTMAARTELPAAERFSARINSADETAGLPDMQELSPLRVQSAKQIAGGNAAQSIGSHALLDKSSFAKNRGRNAACATI
jgi:hypothetical protein